MAGLLANVVVDDKPLVRYVNAVTKAEKRALKNAYRAAVRPIVNEAKKNVRQSPYKLKGSKNGSVNLIQGVRGGAWKNGKGASVYIRSPRDDYYKLLFFESGTKARFVAHRKGRRLSSKAYRGHVDGGWFFKRSLDKHVHTLGDKFDEVLFNAIKNAERK